MLKLLLFWIRFIIQHVSVERDLDTSETHMIRGLLWSWARTVQQYNTHVHYLIKLIQTCAYVSLSYHIMFVHEA